MNAAFPYALTSINPETIEQFELPDLDDRHIAAGALACEAQIIVTHNIKDFPDTMLAVHGIRAVTPGRLLLDLFNQEPERLVSIIKAAAIATRNPPRTVEDILIALELAGVRDFAKEIRTRLACSQSV